MTHGRPGRAEKCKPLTAHGNEGISVVVGRKFEVLAIHVERNRQLPLMSPGHRLSDNEKRNRLTLAEGKPRGIGSAVREELCSRRVAWSRLI